MTLYSGLALGGRLVSPAPSFPPGPFNDGDNMPGFTGDTGHYFTFTSTQVLYYNASDVLQWSVTRTSDIHASTDFWVGFMLDSSASLLYTVAVDTTAGRYYTASIDSSGTVVNIGNAVPSTDFTNTPSWSSSGQVYRTADGSGNLFVRFSSGTAFEEMTISIADGSIVADAAQITGVNTATALPALYKTTNGVYVGGFRMNLYGISSLQYLVGSDGAHREDIILPPLSGFGGAVNSLAYPLQWNGYIVLSTGATATDISGPRRWEPAKFDAAIERLARFHGLTV